MLTERIDRLIDADGKAVLAIRLMGILELGGNKIVHWRDSFDTAAIPAAAAPSRC